jgi:hypothetical protein
LKGRKLKMKEFVPDQYAFDTRVFLHPLEEHLSIDPGVIHVLQTDRKWQALDGDRAGLVDLERNLAVIIHPQSLTPDVVALDLDFPHERNLSGIAVITEPITDQDEMRDCLSDYQKPLAYGGLLLVIERHSDSGNTIRRVTALQQAGFVYPRVTTTQEGYVVWHANKEKSGKHEPVNVWESKNGPKILRLYEETIQKYNEAGFAIVDGSPIFERLSHSTYQIHDEDILQQGGGFIVQPECGCTVEHSFSGFWNITTPGGYDCQHAGLADAIERFEKLTPYSHREFAMPKQHSIELEPPPSERFIGRHGCGWNLIEESRELRQVHSHGKLYVRYQTDRYCTSCGDIFQSYTRFVDVPV